MDAGLTKRIMRYLAPEALAMAVVDALGRKGVAKFIAREGIEYPGARIAIIPTEHLVEDLIEEAMQHEPILERLVSALDREYAETIRRVRGMDPSSIRREFRTVEDLLRIGVPGGFIWALVRDGRDAAAKEAMPLFLKVHGQCKRAIEGAIRRGMTADRPKTAELKRDLAMLKNTCERLEEENAGLKRRLQEYKTEAERLSDEKGALAKEKRGLGDMIRKLTERVGMTPGGAPEDSKAGLRRRARELEKENERLAHDLAKIRESSGSEIEAERRHHARSEGELRDARLRIDAMEEERKRAAAETAALKEAVRAFEEKAARSKDPAVPPVASGRRVGIFVDVQNVYYLARDCYGRRTDYAKLLESILRGRHCVKALCYVVEDAGTDIQRFIRMLTLSGYTVRTRPLIRRADGSAKGNWDVGIATDVMTLVDKNKLDVVVLVTCDGDFVDLVNVLKHKGLRVEVVGFPQRTAMSLQGAADEVYFIREDLMLREKAEHDPGDARTNSVPVTPSRKPSEPSCGPPRDVASREGDMDSLGRIQS